MSQKKTREVMGYTSKDGGPIKFPKFPGRNDLCYCGSGKKYKSCHLQVDYQQMRNVK